MIDKKINEYIITHISPEPEILANLYRETWIHRLYPRMCTDHYQGRVLKMLTEMIRPVRILELGTFSGYSTLCLAEGMPEGCTIDTIEIDDEWEDDLRKLFDDNIRGKDITLHIGDAEQIVPSLPGCWDLIYIDANKRRYPQYLSLITDRLAEGGYIIADNTLWSGQVIEENPHDLQLKGILEFNKEIKENPLFECIILPIRDGISLIRKKTTSNHFTNYGKCKT